MGSESAETIVGRASPAVVRARAARISSLRSPAIRTTSARLSGDGSVASWAVALLGDPVTSTISSTTEEENRVIAITGRRVRRAAGGGPTSGYSSSYCRELLVQVRSSSGLFRRVTSKPRKMVAHEFTFTAWRRTPHTCGVLLQRSRDDPLRRGGVRFGERSRELAVQQRARCSRRWPRRCHSVKERTGMAKG